MDKSIKFCGDPSSIVNAGFLILCLTGKIKSFEQRKDKEQNTWTVYASIVCNAYVITGTSFRFTEIQTRLSTLEVHGRRRHLRYDIRTVA